MDKDQITTATITTTTITTQDIYITTNYVLNSLSILFSLLLIIIIITLRIKEINFSNRISLRLIMYISITEIFFSISQIFRINFHQFSIWVSYLSSWGYIFNTLLICSLIMSILINLQLSLTYNCKDIIHLKKYYLIMSLSFAIMLSVLPITFGKFNFDQERNYFWYDTVIWEWSTYTGWITFSILYCVVSIIHMFYRLNEKSQKTSTTMTLSKEPTQSKLISKYISRIIFYSLIPILSYLPLIILNLSQYYTNRNFFFLDLLSLIFLSSQSMFTFIIFLFDPIIDEVILERKRNIEHKNYVLDNVKKGVYVENIYNIEFELPSNNQNGQQQQSNDIKKNKIKKYSRSTIYGYAKNAKNRISVLSSVIYNRKKSVDFKEDDFNFDKDDDDLLSLL